jgi:flagellar secretion chaperone FliS
MSSNARDVYLETEVRTATPQKLRLMLIDGALRFARQARDCWDDADRGQARCAALAKCHDILTELYHSIRADQAPVAREVKSIYRFLHGRLADATGQADPSVIEEVIGVLEVERETWRQVCEALPDSPDGGGGPATEEITAGDARAIPSGIAQMESPGSGLSLEA